MCERTEVFNHVETELATLNRLSNHSDCLKRAYQEAKAEPGEHVVGLTSCTATGCTSDVM